QGRTYKEIAMGMGLSAHTIHSYIKQIYEKLQAANRAEAIHKARTLGVI
ncbi:MAG: response regulator transcription factor, partial [Kiritimatiellia bacterium]